MPIEKLLTFTCFGIWALSTLLIIILAMFRPNIARLGEGRRFKASNFFDLALLASVGAWLAMWCFRSMY